MVACILKIIFIRNMDNFEKKLQNLPKLPVPKLKDTLRKYVMSLKPMISTEELSRTVQLVNEFETSELVKKLQEYLEKRAEQKINWLDEWYISIRYLDNRLPTALCSSPSQMFPLENFENEQDRLSYTAKLILGAAVYKLLIDRQKLPIDRRGNIERDMSQYSKLFGTCRKPCSPTEKNAFYPYAEHIIIAHKNQFFKLQLFHNSHPISEMQLLVQLKSIVSQPLEQGIPIGILTTEQRDTWTSVYEELIKDNHKEVKDIESCLFLVCLDCQMPEVSNKMTKAGMQVLHGGGSKLNAGNRWFDKTLQFIVGNDGIAGLTFEHLLCDGQAVANMVENIIDFVKDNRSRDIPDVASTTSPSKLHFHITDSMLSHIKEAESNFNKSVDNCDIEWFKFEFFGKDFIKNAKLSPDSFVQIALQLAFYRLHGVPGSIYESVATNKYARGRLESLRSFSEESVTFVKTALDPNKTNKQKLDSLRLAVNTHKKSSLEAGEGYGTERHFLGLKAAAKEMGVELPPLYFDSTYITSITDRCNSSQVVTKCDALMGYGTIPTDLYTYCYNVRNFDINISIFSFKSNNFTDSVCMKNAIISSLCDMKDILLHVNQ
ncbi:hypothetical protein RI129_005433 [Pyrocoelia pectoralis]|uniref:Choline/carnitine acyltransferase domain-containing protein n=1 Tax=Pyrocoelia pectoralis TaxID=417401 RepID=A0AAN7VNF2_9COLE